MPEQNPNPVLYVQLITIVWKNSNKHFWLQIIYLGVRSLLNSFRRKNNLFNMILYFLNHLKHSLYFGRKFFILKLFIVNVKTKMKSEWPNIKFENKVKTLTF